MYKINPLRYKPTTVEIPSPVLSPSHLVQHGQKQNKLMEQQRPVTIAIAQAYRYIPNMASLQTGEENALFTPAIKTQLKPE